MTAAFPVSQQMHAEVRQRDGVQQGTCTIHRGNVSEEPGSTKDSSHKPRCDQISSCSQTQHCTHPTPPLCPRRGGFTSPSSGSFQELPELIAPNPSTKGSHLVQGLRSSRRRQHNVGEQFLCISGSSCGL